MRYFRLLTFRTLPSAFFNFNFIFIFTVSSTETKFLTSLTSLHSLSPFFLLCLVSPVVACVLRFAANNIKQTRKKCTRYDHSRHTSARKTSAERHLPKDICRKDSPTNQSLAIHSVVLVRLSLSNGNGLFTFPLSAAGYSYSRTTTRREGWGSVRRYVLYCMYSTYSI